MIVVSVTEYPKKEIVAKCTSCGAVVKCENWDTYSEYKRRFFSMRKRYNQCPHCVPPVQFGALKWERHYDVYGRVTQDWEAKIDEGDFLIWKKGKMWQARYRAFGSDDPQMLGISKTKGDAKKLCERSRFNTIKK